MLIIELSIEIRVFFIKIRVTFNKIGFFSIKNFNFNLIIYLSIIIYLNLIIYL